MSDKNGTQPAPAVLHVQIMPAFDVQIHYVNQKCLWVAKCDVLQIGVMAETPHELQQKIKQVMKEHEKPKETSRIVTV